MIILNNYIVVKCDGRTVHASFFFNMLVVINGIYFMIIFSVIYMIINVYLHWTTIYICYVFMSAKSVSCVSICLLIPANAIWAFRTIFFIFFFIKTFCWPFKLILSFFQISVFDIWTKINKKGTKTLRLPMLRRIWWNKQ